MKIQPISPATCLCISICMSARSARTADRGLMGEVNCSATTQPFSRGRPNIKVSSLFCLRSEKGFYGNGRPYEKTYGFPPYGEAECCFWADALEEAVVEKTLGETGSPLDHSSCAFLCEASDWKRLTSPHYPIGAKYAW